MTKPRAKTDADKASAEKIAIRFLIDLPTQGWESFPISDALPIYSGGKAIPELANQTVWIAIAHVVIEGRRVKSLARLQMDRWMFDQHGRADQKPLIAKIVGQLHRDRGVQVVKPKDLPEVLGEADLDGIRRALGMEAPESRR